MQGRLGVMQALHPSDTPQPPLRAILIWKEPKDDSIMNDLEHVGFSDKHIPSIDFLKLTC